jgi:hypothetical protein
LFSVRTARPFDESFFHVIFVPIQYDWFKSYF